MIQIVCKDVDYLLVEVSWEETHKYNFNDKKQVCVEVSVLIDGIYYKI